MSKILPEEELDLSDQPLHEGTPVFPPEGLTMKQFSDLVMMCEYLWHYGELLYQDDSQGRPPTVGNMLKIAVCLFVCYCSFITLTFSRIIIKRSYNRN
jgi:hypothetical protein